MVKTKVLVGGLVMCLLGSFLFGACAPQPAEAPVAPQAPQLYKWRCQSTDTLPQPAARAQVEFIENVKTASNGAIDITWYPAGQLMTGTEILKSVGEEVIEMGMSTGGYNLGTVPEWNLENSLIGSFISLRDGAAFWEGGYLDLLRKACAKQNVYYVWMFNYSVGVGLISRVPIRSIEDFKGLTIRTISPQAEVYEALGAKTVYVPGEEVYTGLQLGTFDAATWTRESSWVQRGWHEAAKYAIAEIPGWPGAAHLIINMDVWKALPDNLKVIIDQCWRATTFKGSVYEQEDNLKAHKIMEEAGCEFITLSPEDNEKIQEIASTIVWDMMAAKDPKAAEAIQMLREFMTERGYIPAK